MTETDSDDRPTLPYEPDNRPTYRHMDLCNKLALVLSYHDIDTGADDVFVEEIWSDPDEADLYRVRVKDDEHGGEPDLTSEALTEPELASWIQGLDAGYRDTIGYKSDGEHRPVGDR